MNFDNYEDYKCENCKRQMDLQEQQEFKERGFEHMLCWDCFIAYESILKNHFPNDYKKATN